MKENLRWIFVHIGVICVASGVACLSFWAFRRPSPVQRITEAIGAGPTNRALDNPRTNVAMTFGKPGIPWSNQIYDYTVTWHEQPNGYALDIDITNAVGAAQDSANSFTFFYGHTGKLFRVRIVPEPAPIPSLQMQEPQSGAFMSASNQWSFVNKGKVIGSIAVPPPGKTSIVVNAIGTWIVTSTGITKDK